ncbi:MAG: ABC transporter permease [Planctomycetia bacterium]|nr:ABC transporter permease [Planctomycetia bacterium]
MKTSHLLRSNVRFHWRANLAVCLGVAVGTVVLTGALLVGDSLRGSLRALSEQRLGWVDQALIVGRFFRQELASELRQQQAAAGIAPVVMLQGAATAENANRAAARRAGRVTVLGVEDSFWLGGEAGEADPFWKSTAREVVLNQALADELHVQPGDSVTLHLQKASAVSRETAFGRREGDLSDLTLKVRAVLPADSLGADFSLQPGLSAPFNAFVPLAMLQEEMEQKGRVNALLARQAAPDINEKLQQLLTLDDWGLLLWSPDSRTKTLFEKLDRNRDGQLSRAEWRDRVPHTLADLADPKTGALTRAAVLEHYRQRGYLSLESRQLLLGPEVDFAAERAAFDLNLSTGRTFVYLANTIAEGGQEIPYSVVAALHPGRGAPLGPFLPEGVGTLKDDEIILARWEESPLPMKVGDEVKLTYFAPVEDGKLTEKTASFKLRGTIPLTGVADDADLTPEFPGITDKLTLRDWNPPFPYDGKRIQQRDEEYWHRYRTTPKAYVTLAAGQKLWGSRFGELTSIRLAPGAGEKGPRPTVDLDALAASFRKNLLGRLRPQQAGFVFDNVRQRGLESASGGMNFSLLFLGFSFFLIAAALLLVGLLFRLNLDRRASEIGLLLATGFRPSQVRNLLLAEGAVVAMLGGLLGLALALAYAGGLLWYLHAHWPGQLDRSFLRLHVTPQSLLIGYGASLLVSLATIAWAVRVLRRSSPSMLLHGATDSEGSAASRPRWAGKIAIGSTLVGCVLIIAGAFLQDHMQQAGAFFSGGGLLLTAGLAAVWLFLRRPESATARLTVLGLGTRNAGRHPVRSLLTAGLLASAAFLIVAVESFRRQPAKDFLQESGGSGGFALLAESEAPFYQDLNSGPGRAELLQGLERYYRIDLKEEPAKVQQRLAEAEKQLEQVRFVAFRLRAGDDASCLNLYQPRRPRVLGVPESLIQRGGFQFAGTLPAEGKNPWLLLNAQEPVRAFVEQNTAMWMLGSALGGTVEVTDERGIAVPLQIAGLLKDSVFQSELLLSERDFLKLYPKQEGYRFFLIQTPPGQEDAVSALLETAFADRGFEVTPTTQKLATYLAVENTYLSTFQALGGLGLLLGSLGLAVVLLRSVWERRGELALLRALGFRRQTLGQMVLAENVLLLALGLLVGVAAALLSVLPHILTGTGHIPWLRLAGLLGLVLLVGLVAGAAAMRSTLNAPLLPALRKE